MQGTMQRQKIMVIGQTTEDGYGAFTCFFPAQNEAPWPEIELENLAPADSAATPSMKRGSVQKRHTQCHDSSGTVVWALEEPLYGQIEKYICAAKIL